MIVFSFSKKRGVKIAVITVFAAFMAALCFLIAYERQDAVSSYATADEIGRYSTEAPDADAQADFLLQFGLEADKKSRKTDKITIPVKFNEVYTAYNELQKAVGLNLEPYKGIQAQRAVYKIKNEQKYATLIIYKARVIGGHLSTGIFDDGYEALNGKTG